MPRILPALCLTVFGIACGGAAVLCFAGPVLPSANKRLPDPILSLANLKRVRVRVTPISPQLTRHDVTVQLVREKIETVLKEMRVTIVDDPEAPKLEFMTVVVVEPTIPEATAFNMRILLYQSTRIDRLDRSFIVPTYSDFNVSLDRTEKLRETAVVTLEQILSRFRKSVEDATRAIGRETEPPSG
ncbi:MAG: hypothetical protein CMJ18_17590 [Phycisphaeraceae bacterium]|nr:hypothetical protein [Phycisphaeraceae bacterium]